MENGHNPNRGAVAFAFLLMIAQAAHPRIQSVLHYYKIGYFEWVGGMQGCRAALDSLGNEYHFVVKHSKDTADLMNVKNFDLVVFDNNTDASGISGSIPLNGPGGALKSYMENGGKFLGFSGAADHRGQWDWYDTALFSGVRTVNWAPGPDNVYRTALSGSGHEFDIEVGRMWAFMRDSLRLAIDSININAFTMHFDPDVLGKPGVSVLQELRGRAATNGIRQSYTWTKEFKGGGRMIYTGLGSQLEDWTRNDSWLKKATSAYIKLLGGEFAGEVGIRTPEIRLRGSRLEVQNGANGNVRVTDLRGRRVASGSGSRLEIPGLHPGVYIVTTRKAGTASSVAVAVP